MAAGATYEPIATTTLGTATTSYTFSSISGSYTDLFLVVSGTLSNADSLYLRFNGNTATNYSRTFMLGNSISATSSRDSTINGIAFGSLGTTQSHATASIMNYADTNYYKSTIGRYGLAINGQAAAVVGTWRSTAAITSITVLTIGTFAPDMQVGTTLTLYGIKAA